MKWINWLLTPSRKPEFETVNYEGRGGQGTRPLPDAVRPPPPPCPPMKLDWLSDVTPYFVIAIDDNGKLFVERVANFRTRLMRARFAPDDDGNPMHFTTRELALAYLNEHFRQDAIRTEDYTGQIA